MGEEEQRQAGREREGSVHTLASLSRTSMSTPGPGSASLNPKSIRFLKMKLCLHTAVVLGAFSVFSLFSLIHSAPFFPPPFTLPSSRNWQRPVPSPALPNRAAGPCTPPTQGLGVLSRWVLADLPCSICQQENRSSIHSRAHRGPRRHWALANLRDTTLRAPRASCFLPGFHLCSKQVQVQIQAVWA